MRFIRRILYPINFSAHCESAASYVAALASRLEAELELLYVVDIFGALDSNHAASPAPHSTEHWQTQLSDFARLKFSGLPFRCFVREGEVATAIARFASEMEADLITMSSVGRTDMHPFAIGSVTDAVLHRSSSPIWVTSELKRMGRPLVPRVVMCAVELLDEEVPTMRFAADFSAAVGAQMIPFHVEPEIKSLVKPSGVAAGAWNAFRRRSGIDVDLLVSQGDLGRQIQRATVDHKVDLLIMGRRSLRESDTSLKTHVYTMIARSSCPALVV
jgi:nucleotide-binding universal stress UspA family protein